MYKFIMYFIIEWWRYPRFKKYCEYINFQNPELYQKMEENDKERGIKPYKNRLDYAIHNAKLRNKHRDRYGRKCRKYGGDCERCNAKHC